MLTPIYSLAEITNDGGTPRNFVLMAAELFRSLISLDVPTISNRHLKIYSIGYDEDSSSGIPPLVYAQDLSANGTLLKRPKDDADPGKSNISQLLRKAGKPVLLSNEDQLFVSPSISFTFVARDPTRVRIKAACKIQQVEK